MKRCVVLQVWMVFMCVGIMLGSSFAEEGPLEHQTLEGEDRNGDGVWDDVESYIDQQHANSQKMRAALRQYAKTLQATILDSQDEAASQRHANDRMAARKLGDGSDV